MQNGESRGSEARQHRLEQLCDQLRTSPPQEKKTILQEIKEFFERSINYQNEYPTLMKKIIPLLSDVMRTIPPQEVEGVEQEARQLVLELIFKCPSLEPVQFFYSHVLNLCHEVMENDNENNTIIAIKIFIDWVRAFKNIIPENYITKFVGFCLHMFKNFKEILEKMVDSNHANLITKGTASLRVLMECGNAITSLWHHYQRHVPIKDFIVYAFEIVIQEKPERLSKRSKTYEDLIFCQTKMLNFLAQFSSSDRNYQEFRQYEDQIAQAVIYMMKTIPSESYNIRKDLFLGFSHLIKSSHRRGFFKYIDSMLDEEAILGKHTTPRNSWFGAMLEFLEIARQEMTPLQLCKATALICRNMHFIFNLQLQSLNVLKLFLENIRMHKENYRVHRDSNAKLVDQMYHMLLLTVSKRLSNCRTMIDDIIPKYRESRNNRSSSKTSLNIHEIIALLKKVIELAKTLIYDIICGSSGTGSHQGNAIQDEETARLLVKIFKNMILCARIFSEINFHNQEKVVFQNITQLISSLHPTSLQDILRAMMPFLFVLYLDKQNIGEFFRELLTTNRENLTPIGEVLISFIIDNMEMFEAENQVGDAKMLKLIKKAKIKPENVSNKKNILFKLFKEVLAQKILDPQGKSFIKKCEELCIREPLTKFNYLAKCFLSAFFDNKQVRQDLTTPWLQQQDPLLASNPAMHDIIKALKSSHKEFITNATIIIEENVDKIEPTPELLTILYKLIHRPNLVNSNRIIKILGMMGSKAREINGLVNLRTWKAPLFPEPLNREHPGYFYRMYIQYDADMPPLAIPLDYVLSKIARCFRVRLDLDISMLKKLVSASKIVKIALSSLLSKIQIDTNMLLNKAHACITGKECIEDYDSCNPIPLIHQIHFREILKFTLKALTSLLFFQETKGELASLFEYTCRHFALLMIIQLECNGSVDPVLPSTMILEVLSEKLAVCEKDVEKNQVIAGFMYILDTVNVMFQGKQEALRNSAVVREVLMTLYRGCFKPNLNEQHWCCEAFTSLLSNFPKELLEIYSRKILKAPIHILESLIPPVYKYHIETCVRFIRELADYCPKQIIVAELMGGLISSSATLRKVARNMLPEVVKPMNLYDFLEKFKEPLPNRFMQSGIGSLRSQLLEILLSTPVTYLSNSNIRTAVIEAFTYCLKQGLVEPIINHEPNPEVFQFIEQVIELIPVELGDNDIPLNQVPRVIEDETQEGVIYRPATQHDLTLDEKCAIYELLRIFLSLRNVWELIRQKHNHCVSIRNAIVFRFLRAMSENQDMRIIESVKAGIKYVMNHGEKLNILPQEELKKCMRPTLLELAKNSTAPSLEQLQSFSRYLELIADCFNKNLGDRLLKHLQDICKCERTQTLAKIPTIMNLFHLLPECSNVLLPDVIRKCNEGESLLKRSAAQGQLFSYFKENLVKYLSRFADNSLAFFFQENVDRWFPYLCSLLAQPNAYILRDKFAINYKNYLMKYFINNHQSVECLYWGMKILNNLNKYMPRWIATKPDIIEELLKIWKEQLQKDIVSEELVIKHGVIEKGIITSFINFIRYNGKDAIIPLLFELPHAYARRHIGNTMYLTKFLTKEVAQILKHDAKKALVKKFITFLHNPTISVENKARVIEHLVVPFLTEIFSLGLGRSIISKKIQLSFIDLVKKHHTDSNNTLSIQLMNLGSLMIENLENEFWRYRKELIKFSWGMIKSENPIIKGSAYVNVSRFIKVYSLPDSLIVQLLGALFKAHNSDIVFSSQQAFSYLSDRLIRLFSDPRLKDYLTEHVKRILHQETRQPQSMLHVIDIIIKNESVFYYIREGLVPYFLNWINTLGLGYSSNYNAKKTLLDLTEVIIMWSQRQLADGSYLQTSHKDMLVNFFARFGQAPALYISKTPQRNFEQLNSLSTKCTSNLEKALSLWGDITFKAKNWTDALRKCVQYVEQQTNRSNSTDALKSLVERSLNVVKILAKFNTKQALIGYPDLIGYIAQMVKTSQQPKLVDTLCEIISTLLSTQTPELLAYLHKLLESAFTSDAHSANHFWSVKLLSVLSDMDQFEIVPHIKGLVRTTVTLATELLQEGMRTRNDKEVALLTALNILSKDISILHTEHKNSIKQVLCTIFEHFKISNLIESACSLVKSWISHGEDLSLSHRELCNMLLKFFTVNKLDVQNAAPVLEISYTVLSKSPNVTEAKLALCKAILIYLQRDPSHEMISQFDEVLKSMIGNSVWRRLLFIIEQLECTEPKLWIKSSVDCMLSALEDKKVIKDKRISTQDIIHTDWKVSQFLTRHYEFINSARNIKAKDFIEPLRKMLNVAMSHYLFCHFFSQLWGRLTKSQQESLTYAIEDLLMNRIVLDPTHQNITKTILIALSSCSPLPAIRPEVLQYVAKISNSWNVVIPLLETYSAHLPDPRQNTRFIESLYNRLNESEYEIGWKLARSVSSDTKSALNRILSSDWYKGREMLEDLLARGTDKEDADIWTAEWLTSVKMLGDWDTLKSYGERRHQISFLEGCWQTDDLQSLKSQIAKLGYSTHPTGYFFLTIQEISEANNEELKGILENRKKLEMINSSIQQEWMALPKYPSSAQKPLLQQIQMHTELTEGLQILVIVHDHLQNNKKAAWAFDQVNSWRQRSLSVDEGPYFWHSVLKDRRLIFKIVNDINGMFASHLSIVDSRAIQDTPWTYLSEAKLERKANNISKAVQFIQEACKNTDVNEAYLAIREQVKICQKAGDFDTALSICKSQADRETFLPVQKAELRRLKGMIYYKLGDLDRAKNALAIGLKESEDNWKLWLDTGDVCEALYSTSLNPDDAVNAIVCYALGIHKNLDKYKLVVAKMLHLMEAEHAAGVALEGYLKDLPSKIWEIWVPQLLAGLDSRSQMFYMKILEKLAMYKPQTLFYYLRKNIIERQEKHRNSSNCLELLQYLKKSHPLLYEELLNFANLLSRTLKVTLEEELYCAVSSLYNYYLPITDQKYHSILEALDQIIYKFFERNLSEDFESSYSEEFKLDFDRSTLNKDLLFIKLKKWKDELQYVNHRSSLVRYLEDESPELSYFTSQEIYVPGTQVIMQKFLQDVYVCRSRNFNRVISMKGEDERIYSYIVAVIEPYSSNMESMNQVLSVLNHAHTYAPYKKGLRYETNIIVPLDSRRRLISYNSEMVSLKELYEMCMEEMNQEADLPLSIYKEILDSQDMDPETSCHIRIRDSGLIPDFTLGSYIQRILQNPDRYAIFRKQFTTQLSLFAQFCHMFKIPLESQTLDKIWLSRSSGGIYPIFLDTALSPNSINPPFFRNTRNFTNIINEGGMRGVIPSTIHTATNTYLKHANSILSAMRCILAQDCVQSVMNSFEEMKNVEDIYEWVIQSQEESCRKSPSWLPWF